MKKSLLVVPLAALMLAGATQVVQAKGRLTMYCSAQGDWCQKAAETFGKKYDVKVAMTRNGSGSTYAKILAEKKNPRGDVWYGGTLDPHSQAGVNGLLESYKSPNLEKIAEPYRNPAASKQNHSTGIYIGILGFSVNTDLLKDAKLEMPKCWADLTKPEFKGKIQIASPQSSGTAYTALATFTQMYGEDKAFEYLTKLHQNVGQYTKSGSAPGKNAARGETMIGIGFLHDHGKEKAKGFPLELVAPCEGTGYEIGGLSIIKNARNMDNAKLFVDWALSKEGMEVAASVQSFQVPTNTEAAIPAEAIRPENVNLIDYDFVKYGGEEMRKALISRWVEQVKPLKR
ncbi:MAG TPA: ABC transporter substrate-binding protein [Desulfobacterales bacterium]|nr:ABC transporter substrate-binding protein [Desulfobacterales bacterium]HIP39846.1 ABC transporter substrate-binding protein [Desulfocapsa sulfexigens]